MTVIAKTALRAGAGAALLLASLALAQAGPAAGTPKAQGRSAAVPQTTPPPATPQGPPDFVQPGGPPGPTPPGNAPPAGRGPGLAVPPLEPPPPFNVSPS